MFNKEVKRLFWRRDNKGLQLAAICSTLALKVRERMELDGAHDVEVMEKENRCRQNSESKINISPSGEPL